jgi:hypothetical protein
VELTCQLDVVPYEGLGSFGDLTCDFWAENSEKLNTNGEDDIQAGGDQLDLENAVNGKAVSGVRCR